ncbi:MAG TPA: hypothetical protein VED00_00710 [archaeon]|nr:hypothetical protein [archaeon]
MRKVATLFFAIAVCVCMLSVISVGVQKTAAVTDSQWNCSSASRSITIDAWGSIHVADSYYITNNSNSTQSYIAVNVPKSAQDITASDTSGPISTNVNSTASTSDQLVVDVDFRSSLNPAQNYTVTVNYIVPATMYVKQLGSWDHYELNFPAYPNADFPMSTFSLSVALPEGATYEAASPALDFSHSNFWGQTLVFSTLYNVNSTSQELSLTVKYQYIVFWAAFNPVVFFGTFIVVVEVVWLARRKIKPAVPSMAMPLDVVRSFVEDYDEKVSLLAELEDLEEDLVADKIKKNEYKQRLRRINEDVTAINRELIKLKPKIKSAGGVYADAVKKIEIAELEIETARRNINDVKSQYRMQKISRDAYHTLLADYRKRLNRSKSSVDNALINLREEMR